MIEDKLTADQRIRLEAVNQANARLAATERPGAPRVPGYPYDPMGELITAADRIAEYIRDRQRVPR